MKQNEVVEVPEVKQEKPDKENVEEKPQVEQENKDEDVKLDNEQVNKESSYLDYNCMFMVHSRSGVVTCVNTFDAILNIGSRFSSLVAFCLV